MANAYGYMAFTETIVAVADRATLSIWVSVGNAPANKVTERGAALRSGHGAAKDVAELVNGTVGERRKAQHYANLRSWVHEQQSRKRYAKSTMQSLHT